MTRQGDSLTVVRGARGRALIKRYHLRGGRLVKSNYPNVAEVVATEVPVDGIDSLAAALDSVTAGGIAAVIRGVPGKFYPRNGLLHSVSCARKRGKLLHRRAPGSRPS